MSIDSERELYRAIKMGQFPPVYHLHGENDLLKDSAVRDLVAAAVEPSTRDFNLDQIYGDTASAEFLESLLLTPPMMATRRVTVIREVQALRKDARAVLDRYLAKPSPDSLLVVVSAAGAKEDKSLSDASVAVEFGPLRPDRVPKWIRHYVGSLGVEITEDAVELLMQVVGPDLPHLAAELEKLANYSGGRTIDQQSVSAVVGVRHGETLGDLLDAVATRDASRALSLFPHIMEQPKITAVFLLMTLSTQTIAIAWGRAARVRGVPQNALEREFFSLLKETRAITGRPWGEAVKCWVHALPHWSDTALDHALDALLEADRAAKETRLSSEEQLVGNIILTICGAGRRVAA